MGNVIGGELRRGPNESRYNDYPLPSRRTNHREEIRAAVYSNVVKLSLKADELQFGQRHEDVKTKREYYHIIFPERN